MESYALLLAAVELMHRTARQDAERAYAMLEHLARRPQCAGVAAAWMAKWHVLRVAQGWSADPAEDSRLALGFVQRSLDEESHDPLALAIGGLVHSYLLKDLSTAGWMYEEAIDINPSEPLAWLFSATRFAYLGQGHEAEQAGERALSLSPLDPMKHFFNSLAATAMLAVGNWERSLTLSRQSIRANRTHASSWRTMTYALVMLDRMDEAREAVRQLRQIEPGLSVAAFRERFPGRDGPMVEPWAESLRLAGLPA
jgi:tetratricopeptide (TPR) repeat protein